MTIGRIPSVDGGIQPTIVDAKGDLIVATAADTVSRLAVGSANQVLTVDSSTSTGLKWAAASSPSYTWSAWTPTWTNLTLGNGTCNANYVEIGNVVHMELQLIFGSTTSISGNVSFSLPVNASTAFSSTGEYYQYGGTGLMWDNSAAGNYSAFCAIASSTTARPLGLLSNAFANDRVSGQVIQAGAPFTWATSDQVIINMWYRKA